MRKTQLRHQLGTLRPGQGLAQAPLPHMLLSGGSNCTPRHAAALLGRATLSVKPSKCCSRGHSCAMRAGTRAGGGEPLPGRKGVQESTSWTENREGRIKADSGEEKKETTNSRQNKWLESTSQPGRLHKLSLSTMLAPNHTGEGQHGSPLTGSTEPHPPKLPLLSSSSVWARIVERIEFTN